MRRLELPTFCMATAGWRSRAFACVATIEGVHGARRRMPDVVYLLPVPRFAVASQSVTGSWPTAASSWTGPYAVPPPRVRRPTV
jgi:hypothetical protein